VISKDSVNSFGARDTLEVGENSYEIYRLDAVPGAEKLPYSLKVLAENLLRTEDGANITKDHIEAIANDFVVVPAGVEPAIFRASMGLDCISFHSAGSARFRVAGLDLLEHLDRRFGPIGRLTGFERDGPITARTS